MITSMINKNYFLNDYSKKILLNNRNKNYNQFLDEIKQIDSILCFNDFAQVIKNKDFSGNHIFSEKRAFGESLLYGHLNEVLNYANINLKESKYFPIIEHGVDFWEMVKPHTFPRAFQGKYLFERFKKTNPGVPAYSIGPLIHYASDYYEESQYNAYKSKIGKTLLIVPSHTHEMASQHYDMKGFVENIMKSYSNGFDTVMILAYWADLKYELYDYFKSMGAVLVSAGFRGDPNFIRRLKTIISLSDKIIGNEIGTFLGYGMYLGKPVQLIENNIQYQIDDIEYLHDEDAIYEYNRKEFYNTFTDISTNVEKKKELCDKFWGLTEIRTPKEINDILYINKEILKLSNGNIEKIAAASKKILESSKISDSQHKILLSAI